MIVSDLNSSDLAQVFAHEGFMSDDVTVTEGIMADHHEVIVRNPQRFQAFITWLTSVHLQWQFVHNPSQVKLKMKPGAKPFVPSSLKVKTTLTTKS